MQILLYSETLETPLNTYHGGSRFLLAYYFWIFHRYISLRTPFIIVLLSPHFLSGSEIPMAFSEENQVTSLKLTLRLLFTKILQP